MKDENSKQGVLITGTSRGIGLALARTCVERGYTVFGFSRSQAVFEAPNYHHFELNVADEKAVAGAMCEIAKQGGLYLLVNNAAIKKDGLSMLTSVATVEAMMQTNQIGSFLVTKYAALLMKKNRRGRVVNLSSVAVPLASLGTVIYGANKASVDQMTKVFAKEFANDDVTLNTVGISSFEGTDMYKSINAKEINEMQRQLLKPGPVQIDELMGVIDFFASDLASKITGQTIYFGGVS